MISIQVLQTEEDSCKKCIRKKICKYFQFWGENMTFCDIVFDVQEFFKKDLLNVLMVKLQTIDIYLGHTRPSFFRWHEISPEIQQQ